MKKVLCLCFSALYTMGAMAELVEKTIVKNSFRTWAEATSVSDKTPATDYTRQLVTKSSKDTITFTFHQTNIYTGGSGKVTAMCEAPNKYWCGMKNEDGDPATVTSSAFDQITTVSFTERATGSNRGWGLKVKGDNDADWVVVYSTTCGSNEQQVNVTINRTNVQLQWYNLAAGQYAAMTNLVIKGMVEDDGQPDELVVAYYDHKNKFVGEDTVLEGSLFVPKYTEDTLSIDSGMKFRGWSDGTTRWHAGDVINDDLDLFAVVTMEEKPAVGSHWKYDLCQASFDPNDHELIDIYDGLFYSAQDGWKLGSGSNLKIIVSPKSYVTFTTSSESETGSHDIRNTRGDSVSTLAIPQSVATQHTFYYANPNSANDTLCLRASDDLFVKTVEIYNVKAPIVKEGQKYTLEGGDVASLLMVISGLQDGDTIYLQDGVYDLGTAALTTIAKNNVVVMGESMEGTIIRNAPPVEQESINNTATILNTGTGNKYEYLTLQNALDYYKNNNGRAVCLQDKGNKTVCYRVRMLSYQDTYYSNKVGSQHYFEECEIHGTVDFICGDGTIYFYNCLLYCEPRKSIGGGSDVITASNASGNDKGYVFDRCTVQSKCPTVSLGRSWNNAPQCVYLLATFDYSAGSFIVDNKSDIRRWTLAGMNSLPTYFAEYCTMDTLGRMISPSANQVTFTYNKTELPMNTIIGYEEAVKHTYPTFFTDWDPAISYAPFPKPTALESVRENSNEKAEKLLINGRLILRKNGVDYTPLGARIP